MKKILLILLVPIFLFGTSCKKDELASLSAKIDGTAWSATPALVLGSESNSYITFYGYEVSGKKILITVKADGVGEYAFQVTTTGLDVDSYAVFFEKEDDNSDTKKYYATTGTIKINEYTEDGKISGTFSFTAANSLSDQIEITEGVFKNVKVL